MSGTVGLFLGAETVGWSLAQFTAAARLAKGLGCTELAVKCADGSIVWYASQGGLGAVRQACLAGGLDMIPYQYSYGDKYGALQQEIAVCKQIMQLRPDHVAMVDMELEWDGQTGWAQTWNAALAPVPGSLLLTTWGNPATQNWLGVIAAIRGCVNVWIPQEYDTVLVNDEGQYPAGLRIQPAINLPESWPGPNDPVAATKTALSRGHDGVWLWEYQLAVQNQAVVKQIAAVVNGSLGSGGGGGGNPQPVSIIIEKDAQGNVTGAHDAGNPALRLGSGLAALAEQENLLNLDITLGESSVTVADGSDVQICVLSHTYLGTWHATRPCRLDTWFEAAQAIEALFGAAAQAAQVPGLKQQLAAAQAADAADQAQVQKLTGQVNAAAQQLSAADAQIAQLQAQLAAAQQQASQGNPQNTAIAQAAEAMVAAVEAALAAAKTGN